MTPTKGMSLDQLLNLINCTRNSAQLSDIEISTRPSNSAPGKTTIEVWTGKGTTLLCKSTHGGAINWFLKGMVAATSDGPLPTIKITKFDAVNNFERRVAWRD